MSEDRATIPGDTRIADIAVKLLRDAAVFFENVGVQNPELDEQMRDNAAVYRHVAELLEVAPDATLDDIQTH